MNGGGVGGLETGEGNQDSGDRDGSAHEGKGCIVGPTGFISFPSQRTGRWRSLIFGNKCKD